MCQLLASGISLHSSFDHLKQLLIGDIHFVFTMVIINIVIYIEHDDLITKPESTAISTDISYTLDMNMDIYHMFALKCGGNHPCKKNWI